jgi:hypothetical protein
MRLLTAAADKGIRRKFGYRNYSVVIGVIEVTALYIAFLALARCAYIEVDK